MVDAKRQPSFYTSGLRNPGGSTLEGRQENVSIERYSSHTKHNQTRIH